MGKEYTYRRCEEEDLPRIAALVNRVLAVDFPESYFRALYFGNPAGKALSVLALFGEEVVGQIGAVPVRFLVKGRETIGVQELDVALLEEHRRLDVFFNIGTLQKAVYKEEKVGFCFGFGIGTTSQISQVLMQKKKICAIPRCVKVLDAAPFLAQRIASPLLAKAAAPAANLFLRIGRPERVVVPPGMRLSRVDRFDGRFDVFWKKVRKDYPIAAVRDAAFLNWRYRDAVHMEYEVFCLEEGEGGAIAGFIVLGENRGAFPIGQVFDIVTPREGDRAVTRCLLRFAVSHYREKGMASVKCWIPAHTHIHPELAAMGFALREKEGRDLLVDPFGLEAAGVSPGFAAEKSNWFFGKGDSDNY